MARRRGTLTLRREDGRIVCDSVTVADSTWRRMRGLLGRRTLPSGEGIVLRPAWSIHTAFMHFPIDVVFIDAEQVVMRVEPSLRPFKTASCRGAREIVELPAGECERRGLAAGDRIAWASRNVANAMPLASRPVAARGAPRDRPRREQRPALRQAGTVPARGARRRRRRYAGLGRALRLTCRRRGRRRPPRCGAEPRRRSPCHECRPGAAARASGRPRRRGAGQAQAPESVRVYDKWQETEAAIEPSSRRPPRGGFVARMARTHLTLRRDLPTVHYVTVVTEPAAVAGRKTNVGCGMIGHSGGRLDGVACRNGRRWCRYGYEWRLDCGLVAP